MSGKSTKRWPMKHWAYILTPKQVLLFRDQMGILSGNQTSHQETLHGKHTFQKMLQQILKRKMKMKKKQQKKTKKKRKRRGKTELQTSILRTKTQKNRTQGWILNPRKMTILKKKRSRWHLLLLKKQMMRMMTSRFTHTKKNTKKPQPDIRKGSQGRICSKTILETSDPTLTTIREKKLSLKMTMQHLSQSLK